MAAKLYKEYGASIRYGVDFGYGDQSDTQDFGSKSDVGQTYVEAWKNGCPIPNRVIKAYNPDAARDRYADVNQTYSLVSGLLMLLNYDIGSDLVKLESRRDGETINLLHEPENVPGRHLKLIAPLSHIKGYGLTRALIEQMGRGDERNEARKSKVNPVLGNAAARSQNALEFMARVSEQIIDYDADPRKVLHHVLSHGNLLEERTYFTFDTLAGIMQEVAPNLWSVYSQLTPSDKKELDVVTFRKLKTPDPQSRSSFTCNPRL